MLWNIWLARNHKFFKDKDSAIRTLFNKARSLTLETISTKNQSNIDITMLSVEEQNFVSYLLDKNNSNQNGNVAKGQHSKEPHIWKIILKDDEFAKWLKNCNSYYLFFDKASKSNLGIVGAGGVIFNANGDCIFFYEWGLGKISNNREEALALYQVLIQLNRLGIGTTKIFGDSAMVISLMAQYKESPNVLLQHIIQRCQFLNQSMTNLSFHHILCSLNKQVDTHAIRACDRPMGSLLCNAEETQQSLP